jgi:hypothetical protein
MNYTVDEGSRFLVRVLHYAPDPVTEPSTAIGVVAQT